jgi:hypothetical protein
MFLFISYNITLLSQSEEIDFFCFRMALIIVKVSNCIIIYVLCFSWFQVMFCDCLYFKCYFVIIFISSDVLWLPLFQMIFCDYLYFKWCFVILRVCCIVHTITCTNVTISHINNQTFYCSLVYTVCSFICSLYFTHNH